MFVIGSLTGSLVGGYQCEAIGRRSHFTTVHIRWCAGGAWSSTCFLWHLVCFSSVLPPPHLCCYWVGSSPATAPAVTSSAALFSSARSPTLTFVELQGDLAGQAYNNYHFILQYSSHDQLCPWILLFHAVGSCCTMAGIDLHCHTIIDLDPLIRIGGGWVIISRQIWDAQFSFFQISAMVFAVLSFCSLLTLAFVKVTECYKFAFTQTNYKKNTQWLSGITFLVTSAWSESRSRDLSLLLPRMSADGEGGTL